MRAQRLPDRPEKPESNDWFTVLISKKLNIDLKTAETADERASRLRREEAEDDHKRRISLMVHRFVLVTVAGALLTSVYVLVAKDPKTGLRDQAMGVITAIVAAGVGYVTGKGSK